jgi:hypothetical protein
LCRDSRSELAVGYRNGLDGTQKVTFQLRENAMKNKHLIPVLILCGLLSACSGSSPDLIPLSPDCERSFDVATVYVDKLESTGRFSPERIDCFRRHYAWLKAAQQDPANRAAGRNADQGKIDYSCRASEKVLSMQIIKADEIPNLSQEEFDASWGKMTCLPR